MVGRGSGGSNAIPIEEHRQRGTLRADRHLKPTTAAPVRLTVADRRRALAGLDPRLLPIA